MPAANHRNAELIAQYVADTATVERFWSYVYRDPTSGCLMWGGAVADGYGVFRIGGRNGALVLAHAFAYRLAGHVIVAGLVHDHRCRLRRCVNEAHIEPKTNRANILAGVGWAATNARKTHCANGHEFTPSNTIRAQGGRRCRECVLARKRRAYAQRSNANGWR